MAIGSAFGLFQIFILLGYGLVTVPRHILYLANADQRYEFTLCQVDFIEDQLASVRLSTEDLL